MNKRIRYLAVFCCTLILLIFWSQITTYTAAPADRNRDRGVTAIAFSPDGKTLASGGADSQIVLLDVATTGKRQSFVGHSGAPVTGLAFSPDGKMLSSSGKDSTVRLWDASMGKQMQVLQGQESPSRTVAISADGQLVASGGEGTRIFVWDATTGTLLRVLEGGHVDFVNTVVFSRNGRTLASGGDDARIVLWDVTTGQQLQTLLGHEEAVTGLAFSPNGKTLYSVSDDTTLREWDLDAKKAKKQKKVSDRKLKAVALSSDGKFVALGSDDSQIVLEDVEKGEKVRTLGGNKGRVNAIAFSPDGNTLASGDANGQVVLSNVKSGQQIQSIQMVSSSGNLLIASSGTAAKSLADRKRQKANLAASSSAAVFSKSLADRKRQKSNLTNAFRSGTLIAAAPAANTGPGGPILVITSSANPFSNYYTEILRNEGLNAFSVSEISSVSPTILANYDLAILAEMTLTPAQVTTLSDWVNAGGNLIAMRPDPQLSGLLGLADRGTDLSNGYLLADTSQAPGNGIVNQTIQFHGTADRYALNGATSLATLYTDATTATSDPAVTLRSVGSNGGQIAAFTYDLARSVVYTHQGNAAWQGQERDGFSPIRSDDQFFGAASFDPQTDWIDLNKVAIPQADEQQRLLANLILKMNLAKKPLPRFWYFPRGKKAVVLMSGDDHANGGTAGRFDQFKANSPAGCVVDNWECIRGTSYIYPNSPLSNAQASAYNAEGFEVALHVNTNCADFNPSSLTSFYTQQLSDWSARYSSLPAPVTQRHHCLVWSDWSTAAKVELNKGIRMDTSYYYWPPDWVANRAGFFTGSGMPMRFADLDGTAIDVYQAATQMTDESGQTYPATIDTLLDRALGAEGYYGVFNVNAHTDYNPSAVSDAVLTSAIARGVPIVSARQMLTWLDGRNSSTFGSLTWNGSTLSFSVTPGAGANGLQVMLPTRSLNGVLTGITLGGSSVTYTVEGIKGIEYALFSAGSGTYFATYTPDTTPPTVTATVPASSATNVNSATTVKATFSEAIDPATINANTFFLQDQASIVPATVTYDAATRSATLKPNSRLGTAKTYSATVKGGTEPNVKDRAGNALAANATWSFTTAGSNCPCSIWNNSTTPANPSVADPNSVELGVRFRSDVNGQITGIRFYKGAGNTGTHVGTLWSNSGQQLATATFGGESASGWQQVNFTTPVAITANTIYVASYHTNVGNYAVNNSFFANSGVDNPPLHALRDGVSGSNGVYRYGNRRFPNLTYQSSNYWVDVVFTPSN